MVGARPAELGRVLPSPSPPTPSHSGSAAGTWQHPSTDAVSDVICPEHSRATQKGVKRLAPPPSAE